MSLELYKNVTTRESASLAPSTKQAILALSLGVSTAACSLIATVDRDRLEGDGGSGNITSVGGQGGNGGTVETGGAGHGGTGGMIETGGGGQGGFGGMETGGGGTGGSGECTNGETQSCGVTNQGECTLGMETCVDGSFDPSTCTAVLPTLEVCGDNLDQDCDGTNDNGCDVTVTFPALSGADCYKAVHFLSAGVNIDSNSSTPDSNQCTKASVTGTYQPGDRAQGWWESTDPIIVNTTEEPSDVELRCSPFTTDPDWADSTAAVQAMDYNLATFTVNYNGSSGDLTITPSGCDEYDFRLTW